ncbi:MAG TPA: L-seryl-tRNA(Sec) selenium transferase [Candidatus Limnocylindrales bacterium]|nr:L-seryl-tRNA(Sec) selenium transferase [Candidatus Limnocylindrales bacterium]
MVSTSRPRPPSVERLLAAVAPLLGDSAPDRDAVVAAARAVIADERAGLVENARSQPRQLADLAEAVVARLHEAATGSSAAPVSVINATGVIVHTNLGRASWPREAIEAARAAAAEPLLLELDRQTGRRGTRYRAAEELLVELTGAEDALVTNNNAAAVALAVALAGRGRGVAVSRGELVEIGGEVRIPDIVRRAGARLVEVGTTNRTRAADFGGPLESGQASLVLRVHRSNFRQEGFTEDPDPVEVARIAHEHGAVVVDDLGSGALLDTSRFGLAHEPLPRERLAAGADVVTFSGDKLVGGPQAGFIVGRSDLVARIRRDPLARAMRPDKVTLAAVAATLVVYRGGRATSAIPVWRMIAATPSTLRERAAAIARDVPGARVAAIESTVGGGSLPGETLPSFGVALDGHAERVAAALRRGTPCVVARIVEGFVVLDVRTIEPDRDGDVVAAVRAALATVA